MADVTSHAFVRFSKQVLSTYRYVHFVPNYTPTKQAFISVFLSMQQLFFGNNQLELVTFFNPVTSLFLHFVLPMICTSLLCLYSVSTTITLAAMKGEEEGIVVRYRVVNLLLLLLLFSSEFHPFLFFFKASDSRLAGAQLKMRERGGGVVLARCGQYLQSVPSSEEKIYLSQHCLAM